MPSPPTPVPLVRAAGDGVLGLLVTVPVMLPEDVVALPFSWFQCKAKCRMRHWGWHSMRAMSPAAVDMQLWLRSRCVSDTGLRVLVLVLALALLLVVDVLLAQAAA